MDRKKTINFVIQLLESADVETEEILIRQIASCNDLLETIVLDIHKNVEIQAPKCDHPKDCLELLNTMGDGKEHLEYHCTMCGDTIIKE